MQVIVLAAGRGERLRPLTDGVPKSLIEIQPGVPLIEAQLKSITASECIDQVVFIVGYRASQIEEYLKRNPYLPITTVYNPFFDVSNNLVSLWIARHYVHGPFIVLNGDDIFAPQVIKRLTAVRDPINMMVSRKPSYDPDDMKVVIQNCTVQQIGKHIDSIEANGESIGMIRFQGEGAERLWETLGQSVREPSGRAAYWLAAVQALIDAGMPVRITECLPSEWAEMDFHADLTHVRQRLDQVQSLWQSWRGVHHEAQTPF
jgi:choline kinase